MPSLSSETAVQRGKIAAPPIVEPPKLDPVILFYQASAKFGWSRSQFAGAFGCAVNTLDHWLSGRRSPSGWVQMHAASLKRDWEREWGL